MATNHKRRQQTHYLHNGTPESFALNAVQRQVPYRKRNVCKFSILESSSQKHRHVKNPNNSMTKALFRSIGNCDNVKENSCKNSNLLYVDSTGARIVKLFLFILIIIALSSTAIGEGNVGCKFVQTLCLDDKEVCYDDHVFGKCIPTTGINLEEIEKSPLTQEQSHLLATMLEEMQGNGLGWDHPYVQCRIQGTLFSLERQTPLPPNLCSNLSPIPPTETSIGSGAFNHFTPMEEYTSNYDAEKYFYPPLKKQYYKKNAINKILQEMHLENDYKSHETNEMLPNEFNNRESSFVNSYSQNDLDKIFRAELKRKLAAEVQQVNALQNRLKMYHLLDDTESDVQPFLRHQPIPPNLSTLDMRPSIDNALPPKIFSQENQRNENTWNEDNSKSRESTFRELSHLQRLQAEKFNPTEQLTEKFMDPPTDDNSKDGKALELDESLRRNSLSPFEEEAFLLAQSTQPKSIESRQSDEVLTLDEGRPFILPDVHNRRHSSRRLEQERKDLVREFFANMLGFSRHERLDVKKPGPLIGPPPSEGTEASDKIQITVANATKENVPHQHHVSTNNYTQKEKKLIMGHSDEDHSSHTVDTEYAHIFIKDSIESWNDGVRIMNELANILHLQGYFNYLTVQPNEISFRVNSSNPKGKNALNVAQAINKNRNIKNEILKRLGITIIKAGVGDKIKWDDDNEVSASYLQDTNNNANLTYILIYMFAGAGAAAIVVLCVTFIFVKRHDRKRDKLNALQTAPGSGIDTCSKDYQELCRARMANKSDPISGGRVASLNKEGDRPPSSRSSTSSWCEEPALTNMDISTGHMVLSYMEDHLRNKDRLQREWEALCRYQAEPATRDMALQAQCISLNRPEAPLPYDHSRVVLNHLANAEGLDYINASTITDHDPRTPAYIAAQGPLPATLAHFWQMIWEQGAVVIVALCRLQENGGNACARYWPEEGADVYHIYEVHLVSEHIWCDDYLVRSFYLKNLRTSETRTVTQFHFLSWPQDGIPVQAKPLLDFRRKVNKSYRGRSCPIVVHSSNGAGRTGAYILLDLVLGRMNKGAREIDIAATLEHLRDQRADLVTTRQQFEFVLMAVAEEVHATLKALPTNPAATANDKKELDSKGEKNMHKE